MGNSDSELMVIDKKFSDIDMLAKTMEEQTDIFTFNVMSSNSLIKDYNLELKLPSGNIGNMYAIQAMSHGNSIFTLDPDVDDAVAASAVDRDALSVLYEPDIGTHRLTNLLDKKNEDQVYNVFNDIDDIISTDVYKPKLKPSKNIIDGSMKQINKRLMLGEGYTKAEVDDQVDVIKKDEVASEDLIAKEDELAQLQGLKVAQTFKDYYDIATERDEKQFRSNLLPYNLNLSLYGIASIQPGDIFKVDYLPEKYLGKTYLQTMKVSHKLNSATWQTNLEGKFRLKPNEKPQFEERRDLTDVVLSANAVSALNLEQDNQANNATWKSLGWADDDFPFDVLSGYMRNIKIVYSADADADSRLDLLLEFELSEKLPQLLRESEGVIQFFEGNFAASWYADEDTAESIIERFGLTYEGWEVHTEKGKVDLARTTDSAGSLGFRYNYHPRDVKLRKGRKYTMMVIGDTWSILDHSHTNYQKHLNFFKKYGGSNYDGTSISSGVAVGAQMSAGIGRFTCFVPGTKVSMYDNSLKNIEDIIVGDKVLSFNTSTSEFGVDKVVKLPKTLGNYKKIIATYEDGTTNEFSPAHPFYVDGKGWSSYDLTDGLITGETEGAPTWSSMDLKQLEVGDYCINNLNKKIKIVSLEETNEYVGMYNLEHLSNNKNWFANGILVKE